MRQKLNLIVKVILFCMLVCFISCEREESLINNQELAQEKTQTEKIKDAEKWFNAYKAPSKTGKSVDGEINKAFQNIDYYWENADIISFDNDSTAVVVPIKDTPEDPNYKGQKMLYLYPVNSKYQSVIQEIFPDSEAIIDDNQKREGFENLDSFSGYIITWDLRKGFIKGARFKNDTLTEEITNVKMVFDTDKKATGNFTGKVAPMFDEGDGVGAERTITVRGGSGAIPLNNVIVTQKSPAPTPKDLSIAGAANAGLGGYISTPTPTGGGGGGGRDVEVTGDASEGLTLPPSCLSFNFTSKKGANWQEAVVKNINFRIIILDNRGIYVNHVVSFPQGVLFGMAINFKQGGPDVTPGAAATVSALVLDKVMDALDIKYARTSVSDLILTTEFKKLLIEEYRIYARGGTVNFNTTSTLPATMYRTNANVTGICD